jgi:hypothetical protein
MISIKRALGWLNAVGGTIDGTTINSSSIGLTTAGKIRSLFEEDVEIATDTLTANQCSGGLISNYNQSADAVMTVPTAFEGGNFVVLLSTAVAKYYRLDPTGSEVFVFDGTALTGGYYVGIASATVGARLDFIAAQTGAATYSWHVYTIAGTWAAQL